VKLTVLGVLYVHEVWKTAAIREIEQQRHFVAKNMFKRMML